MFHEGDVLRKWLDERGWKQKQLVQKTGLDKNTVGRALKGEPLRTETIKAIVRALGHSMEELHRAANPTGELQPGERDHLGRLRRLSDEARREVIAMTRILDERERAAGEGGRGEK